MSFSLGRKCGVVLRAGATLQQSQCLLTLAFSGVPVVAQWLTNLTGTMRLRVRSLALLSGLRIQRCCDLLCRLQTQLRSGVAVALA